MTGALLALLLALQAPAAPGVGDLGWLAGRWRSDDGGRWTEEVWSEPRAGTMMGYSWSGQGETLREYEHLRVAAGEDGVLVYHASPAGQAAAGFRLSVMGAASVTFEDPGHDYPQRIVYRREGETLVATISALDGSHARSWTYRRQ